MSRTPKRAAPGTRARLRALLLLRGPVAALEPLSGRGSAPAFRVRLADGSVFKARLFRTAREAARVQRVLRANPDLALPRPLHRAGRALLLEYVAGAGLHAVLARNPDREAALVRDAGALLARLHRGAAPRPEAPARLAFYRVGLRRALRKLVRARLLTVEEASRLARLRLPSGRPAGLTHGDLWPENLLLTAAGLLAIDEERLALRPLAFDLARAVCLWPLGAALEAELLAGYGAAGGDPGSYRAGRTFWIASALATSAEHRLQDAVRLAGPLAALRELARGLA